MIRRDLQLIEEETPVGFRYVNGLTKSIVGTISKINDGNDTLWSVNSFDDFKGQRKSFQSLTAAKYYLSAFAIEAWEQEVVEMRVLSQN